MNTNLAAHLALCGVALIYGANYVIAKEAMSSGVLSPQGFIVLRVVFGSIAFALLHRLYVRETLHRSDMLYTAVCGLFGITINQLCFFQGLELTSPMHASLIMITTPIIVLVGSLFILKTKATLRQLAGILLGLVGAVLLIRSAGTTDAVSSLVGDLYILTNAISYALYLILAKRLLDKYHPYTVLRWVFFFGMLFVLPFGADYVLRMDLQALTPSHWAAVGYVLVFTTFLAYLLNGYALSKIQPSTVSFYIYFQPLIASLISIGLGQDSLDIVKIQAALFLFAAVYLVLTRKVSSRT